jgi:hypothetical protein
MSATNLVIGDVTEVSTTPTQALGQLYVEPASSGSAVDNTGERVWIYVFNDSGSPLAAAIACVRKAGTATANVMIAPAPCDPARIVGITAHVIANNSYGWIIRRGVVTGTNDAAVTANFGLMPDGTTAGNVTHNAAIVDPSMGTTLAGNGGAGTTQVYLNAQG